MKENPWLTRLACGGSFLSPLASVVFDPEFCQLGSVSRELHKSHLNWCALEDSELTFVFCAPKVDNVWGVWVQALCCVARGVVVFVLEWQRTSCVVREQLQFTGGAMHVSIAKHSEGPQMLWWGLLDSHLVVKPCSCWVFLRYCLCDVLNGTCSPGWVSMWIPQPDVQIAEYRSMASWCILAPGCISPKRIQKIPLQETSVPILNFFSSFILREWGIMELFFYYLLIHVITGYQSQWPGWHKPSIKTQQLQEVQCDWYFKMLIYERRNWLWQANWMLLCCSDRVGLTWDLAYMSQSCALCVLDCISDISKKDTLLQHLGSVYTSSLDVMKCRA